MKARPVTGLLHLLASRLLVPPLSLAVALLACTGEAPPEFGEHALLTPADCLKCHGNSAPDEPIERVVADLTDTHWDNYRINEEGQLVTDETAPLDGYLLDEPLPWADPGVGYVLRGDDNSCSASCHDGHADDPLILRQWAASGHGDVDSRANNREFPTGACLQCHSGIGFAKYVSPPVASWGGPPPDDNRPHRLTCNGCHDGSGYPSEEDHRLRYKSGLVTLKSGSGQDKSAVTDGELDLGESATCAVCHQNRESGRSLYKKVANAGQDLYDGVDETLEGFGFVDSHYRGAASMLFGVKGFEYPGKTYATGNIFHQGQSCVGCHMLESEDPELGGHTLNATGCARCHEREPTEEEPLGPYADFDGDGHPGWPEEELHGLHDRIVEALAEGGAYYVPRYPYFVNTQVPELQTPPNALKTWTEAQLMAGFNLQFVHTEPGAHVHNLHYAVQLLRDAYEDLTGESLAGIRPSSTTDRPATVYTP